MTPTAAVNIAELRALTDRLFEELERRGQSHLPIGQDEFWQLFFEDAFRLETVPTAELASASDCLSDLRDEVANPENLIAWHALHHLSGLLCVLAKASHDH